MTLEGGYGLDGLAYGVVASFAAMLGDEAVADPVGPARYAEKPFDRQYLDQLRALHGLPSARSRSAWHIPVRMTLVSLAQNIEP